MTWLPSIKLLHDHYGYNLSNRSCTSTNITAKWPLFCHYKMYIFTSGHAKGKQKLSYAQPLHSSTVTCVSTIGLRAGHITDDVKKFKLHKLGDLGNLEIVPLVGFSRCFYACYSLNKSEHKREKSIGFLIYSRRLNHCANPLRVVSLWCITAAAQWINCSPITAVPQGHSNSIFWPYGQEINTMAICLCHCEFNKWEIIVCFFHKDSNAMTKTWRRNIDDFVI